MGETRDQESPESILDAIRDHAEWTDAQRLAEFDRLIGRFEPDRLLEAARGRLLALAGLDGEAALRLLESLGSDEHLEELARALEAQPDLPAVRAWDALGLLDEAGLLERHPALAEQWDELNGALEGEGSLDVLVEHIEDDPGSLWVALQGLGPIEPEVRAEIIRGLKGADAGPGLVDFLRLLAHAHEPLTRAAALDVLAACPGDDPRVQAAWATIAVDHADAEAAARARRWLGHDAASAITEWAGPARKAPRIVRSLVTSVDGRGRGHVLLTGELDGRVTTAAFTCDVLRGVVDVAGQGCSSLAEADALYAELLARPDCDVVEDAPALALGLLAGSLLLCGPATSPALRFWLERTAGPGLRPQPFAGLIADWEPEPLASAQTAALAQQVLAACRGWVDDSDLTYDLAEELALRAEAEPPDPARDAGAYRYLFEHRLKDRLELYRRMLFWMASFWEAAGDSASARAALALAWQLSEAQNAVPNHPFIAALTTHSLLAAQASLARGHDARKVHRRD